MKDPEKKPLDLTYIKTPQELLNLIFTHSNLPCECGMTDIEFETHGRFGCAKCYKHFKNKMEKYVYPYHKAHQHIGKKPKSQIEKNIMADPVEKLKLLRLRLAKAIEVEDYESAVVIKQQIENHLDSSS